jgi:hypothetical protein
MQTSKVLVILSLSAAAMLAPFLARAQQPQAQSDTPQKLEKLEEGEPPSIKVGRPEDKRKITEKRDETGVREVKVQTGTSTYYVKPNQQVGNALPGDAQSLHNHGAEWKVMEFDLGSKGKKGDGTSPVAPKDGSVTDEPKK